MSKKIINTAKLAEESMLTQFFILLNRVSIENAEVKVEDDPQMQLVRQVLDYMELHYADQISLEDLEKKFYVSRYKITQHFTRIVGYPPLPLFITNKATKCTKNVKKGESPQQVAVLCGFSDYSIFIDVLKQYTGVV